MSTTAGATPVGAGTAATGTTPAQGVTGTSGVSNTPQTPSMNFRQLDDLCKKYQDQLRDQEKEFLDLATKVNYWDRTLQSNSEKILKMNDSMRTVKRDHEKMLNLIDAIKGYQKDFEAMIEHMESNLPSQQTTPSIKERVNLYDSVENVQVNLQQVTETLKEIVRHANASNRLNDKNDPVSQIIRILNEHTDTLQWVDYAAEDIIDSLQNISTMHQVFRRDHERSLRLMFKPT